MGDVPIDAGYLFVFEARRKTHHSWGSVIEATTLKPGRKKSEMEILLPVPYHHRDGC